MTPTQKAATAAFERLIEELSDADPKTLEAMSFHAKVIRHLKGVISAWEDWIKSRQQ